MPDPVAKRLHFGNVAQNLKLHHQIVSKLCASVNKLQGNRLIFGVNFFISLSSGRKVEMP